MLKRKIQNLTICLTYRFKCLHSPEHNIKKFRKEYQLCEEIGRGGFGVVYKAFRIADSAPVAVKFIPHAHVREWTMLERKMIPTEICYLQECANVPGVVRLVDWFASSKGFMLVMERPNNFMDLFDVVSVYGRLDEDIARKIFSQVVETCVLLNQKHSIVHRDIKDENVIVDMETGQIRLVDFGAADFLERAKIKDFQGTKSYCPPEWFKRHCYLPLESTVWSLGILLYILLTGSTPFKNEIQICVGLPKFPEYVSYDSQNLIKQCLSPFPERRLQLEELLRHPWFKRSLKKFTSKKATGKLLVSNSFRQNKRQPFYTILHRRSIKRRRRRDADAASGHVTDLSDDKNLNKERLDSLALSESSSEAECSYRQQSNACRVSPHQNDSIAHQAALPITVPQKVLDAMAAAIKAKNQQNIIKNHFDKETNRTYESTNNFQESSSGFETAAEEYMPSEEADQCLELNFLRHNDNLNLQQCAINNKPVILDIETKVKNRRKQLLKIHEQQNIEYSENYLPNFYSQASFQSANSIILNQENTDSTNVDEYLLSNFEKSNNCEDKTSLNMYFSALEYSTHQSVCASASEAEHEARSIFDNEMSVLTHKIQSEVINEEEDEKTEQIDTIWSSPSPQLFEVTESSLALKHLMTIATCCSPKTNTVKQINDNKPSTLSLPNRRRRQRRLSRRLRNAAATASIRFGANFQKNSSETTSSDVDLAHLRSSSSDSTSLIFNNYLAKREQSVPCKIYTNNGTASSLFYTNQNECNVNLSSTSSSLDLNAFNYESIAKNEKLQNIGKSSFPRAYYTKQNLRSNSVPIDTNFFNLQNLIKYNSMVTIGKETVNPNLKVNTNKHFINNNTDAMIVDKSGARYRTHKKKQIKTSLLLKKPKTCINKAKETQFFTTVFIPKANLRETKKAKKKKNKETVTPKLSITTVDLCFNQQMCSVEQLHVQINGLKTLETLENELRSADHYVIL